VDVLQTSATILGAVVLPCPTRCHVSRLLLRLWGWKHYHILPLAAGELEYILVPELEVATRGDGLAVQLRAVAAFQVDDVWLDLPFGALHSKLIFSRLLNVPELDGRVLST
jgi:hypothetical protein